MKTQKTMAALAVASVGLLAACGDDDKDSTPASDACPSKLVITTDWFPELEHGGTYQLIGTEGTISKDSVNYSGAVQEKYAVGGLKELEINTVRFDKAGSSILLDGEADMVYINMSDIIKDSAAVDMVAIAKTLDKDPQMVMWDPSQYDIQTPEDIKGTGADVLHFPNVSYIDYMIGVGYMDAGQSNPTYDGSDAQFVASNGGVIQQGSDKFSKFSEISAGSILIVCRNKVMN